ARHPTLKPRPPAIPTEDATFAHLRPIAQSHPPQSPPPKVGQSRPLANREHTPLPEAPDPSANDTLPNPPELAPFHPSPTPPRRLHTPSVLSLPKRSKYGTSRLYHLPMPHAA